jgi:hypothetical protein
MWRHLIRLTAADFNFAERSLSRDVNSLLRRSVTERTGPHPLHSTPGCLRAVCPTFPPSRPPSRGAPPVRSPGMIVVKLVFAEVVTGITAYGTVPPYRTGRGSDKGWSSARGSPPGGTALGRPGRPRAPGRGFDAGQVGKERPPPNPVGTPVSSSASLSYVYAAATATGPITTTTPANAHWPATGRRRVWRALRFRVVSTGADGGMGRRQARVPDFPGRCPPNGSWKLPRSYRDRPSMRIVSAVNIRKTRATTHIGPIGIAVHARDQQVCPNVPAWRPGRRTHAEEVPMPRSVLPGTYP